MFPDRILKPAGTVCYPPTEDKNWNGCAERPPERKGDIGDQAEDHKNQPEHLSLHAPSLHGRWRRNGSARGRRDGDNCQIPADHEEIAGIGQAKRGDSAGSVAIETDRHRNQFNGDQAQPRGMSG